MKLLRFLLLESWQKVIIASLLGLASGACNAKLISLINQAIRQASISQSFFYFLSLLCFSLIIGILSQFILIHLSQDAIYRLRLALSRNILSSPLQHLEQLGEHRLLATLTNDVRVLSNTVAVIPNICVDLATIVGCLVYLAFLSSSVVTLMIGITLIAMWGIQATIRKAKSLMAIARAEQDTLFKHFQAITTGTKELKLHQQRREEFLDEDLRTSAIKLRQKNIKAMKMFVVANNLGKLSLFIILGFILFISPRLLNTPLSTLSTYALTITYLAAPWQKLLNRLPDLMRGGVALDKIKHMDLILSRKQEQKTIPRLESYHPHQIDLNQVTYTYRSDGDEKGFQLGPLSLSISVGQITYIIGGNGSGKSTLFKLIAGLYLPDSGTITLGNHLLKDGNQECYRQHFSAIFSDFYLFDRCLGLTSPDLDQKAEYYLKQLQLDHKVQIKNGILSTTKLSQGQRKRLALLTAYLEDRPIYLFDEWASDQDPMFRKLFYTQILVSLKEQGKTVVVITHDDRYFHLADQVYKLEYGQVQTGNIAVHC